MNPNRIPLQSIFATDEAPDLGPAPRPSRLPRTELESRLEENLAGSDLHSDTKVALRAAALLWHDYLEESHALSQTLRNPDGSFLHGIMHRREPDYTNAKYWFHRVGHHQAFPEISRAAIPILARRNANDLAVQLLPNGLWDPFAFIDAVAEANAKPDHPHRTILIEIQRIEFESLVRHLFA